jgi:AAHS family 4-hydroxybenzoate transporter-like MFS transporter
MTHREEPLGSAAANPDGRSTVALSVWAALFILGLVILVDGLDTGLLAQAIPVIIKDWDLRRSDFGPTLSLALAATAVGSAVGGSLGDRLGRRPVLIASAFMIGAATAGMALSPNLPVLTLARIISGLGLGAAMPATARWRSPSGPPACPPARRSAAFSAATC